MEAATAKVLQARGLVQLLGPDDVVPQSDRLFAATEEAVARGQQCIAANRDTPSAD
jgi:SulP family sulfate permease